MPKSWDEVLDLAKRAVAEVGQGAEWDALQLPFGETDPAPALVHFYHHPTKRHLTFPVELASADHLFLLTAVKTCISNSSKIQRKNMTLKEKLHKIYDAIDAIEKRGHNKSQNYDYIRAADVTNAIRKQLRDLKVYAEINFDFVGAPYTIARAKEKDAPFTAVSVRCFIAFHDLERSEDGITMLTSSGLGTGADTGDKAAYKAQTGALKYALKNAFLVPDEADPEADESVDENSRYQSRQDPSMAQDDAPDFQEARHAAPRPAASPKPSPEPERPTPSPASCAEAPRSKPEPELPPPPPAVPPEQQNHGPAVAPTVAPESLPMPGANELPTEEQLAVYRTEFSKLGDVLSTEGKLKSSKGLPINRKLLVFLLHITKANDAKNITKGQWDDFFRRVGIAKTLENGLIGLAQLVNKANGIKEKQK
jgi:ERF superfamily